LPHAPESVTLDVCLIFKPQPRPSRPPKPENTFRDVISLLAIVVTLTIGLLAYIQREPVFTYKVEVGFLLLVSGPLSGLWHISRAVNQTATARVHLYTPAVRRYAAQMFVVGLLLVGGASVFYWLHLLPGQEDVAAARRASFRLHKRLHFSQSFVESVGCSP
jgi:hypothetical protein